MEEHVLGVKRENTRLSLELEPVLCVELANITHLQRKLQNLTVLHAVQTQIRLKRA
jgi:hypothetical protein